MPPEEGQSTVETAAELAARPHLNWCTTKPEDHDEQGNCVHVSTFWLGEEAEVAVSGSPCGGSVIIEVSRVFIYDTYDYALLLEELAKARRLGDAVLPQVNCEDDEHPEQWHPEWVDDQL
jgi:hypothetical protein